MRDCANCFHRKPVLKEDGTWTAECEKWDCEFQSRENMIEKTKAMNNDIISRNALLKAFAESNHIKETASGLDVMEMLAIKEIIDNAPTVDYHFFYNHGFADAKRKFERPKGEWLLVGHNDTVNFYKCSICGYEEHDNFTKHYNFCPNCGADMRGENK